jgi:hypothetical protein
MNRKRAIWGGLLFVLLSASTLSAIDRLSDAGHKGYSRGYRDGFRHARDDRDAGQNYDDHARNFNGTVRGYDNSMGNQSEYNGGYRDGFADGYDDAYSNRRNRVAMAMGRDNSYDNDRDGHSSTNNPPPSNMPPVSVESDVAYQSGFRDGVRVGGEDLQGGHSDRPHEHDSTYGEATNGYNTSYGDKNRYRDLYRQGFDKGYDSSYNGPYKKGYADGQYIGQQDRSGGHSFRPHEHDSYKNGDAGYSQFGGDKDAYKSKYRNGYDAGYAQGYGAH